MHQATTTSWMMMNREISVWQERALKAEAECERMRAALALARKTCGAGHMNCSGAAQVREALLNA